MVVLQLLGTLCSYYINKYITKFLFPAINFSIYVWFYWHCFQTVFRNRFQLFLHRSKLKFIILNSYKNFKLIHSNHKLNPVHSFRTHCSSDSSISYKLTPSPIFISKQRMYPRHVRNILEHLLEDSFHNPLLQPILFIIIEVIIIGEQNKSP